MEDFYLDEEFEEACINAEIELDDVRYYANEGTIYEFNSQEDLLEAVKLYAECAQRDPCGFQFEVTSVGGVHHLFSKYPPDID